MLSFASAPGNLFNRWGKLGKVLGDLRDYQDTLEADMINTVNGIVAQFDAESDIQAVMGSSYIGILSGTSGSIAGTLQQIAALTANRMVFRDNPRLNQTLQSANLSASLQEIIRQMKAQGATVLASTVAITVEQFSDTVVNTGDGVVNSSVKRPLDGKVLENTFAENLTIICTQDSYIGGATAGNETLAVAGTGAQGDVSAFDWPLGSNASATLNAIDGDADNSSGNLLTNSGFEDWTDDAPDNWELVTGTAGTNVSEETNLIYDPASGGSSLKITGDAGGTLTQIRQVFGDADGTSGDLEALTQYSLNLFLRRDGTAAAAGTLTVDLVDGDGTVVQDMNGVDNSFTVDLTALTVFFAPYSGVFRTPLIMPDELYLRYRLSAALTNGRSVYADKTSMGEMTQVYTRLRHGDGDELARRRGDARHVPDAVLPAVPRRGAVKRTAAAFVRHPDHLGQSDRLRTWNTR
jgi:hypothetical protein